jgi:hypothetical protein
MADLKARNRDPIKCTKGHLVGSFIRDVPHDRKIEAEDLKLACTGLMDPGHGYECPECKEPVATFSMRDAIWNVRLASGWIS